MFFPKIIQQNFPEFLDCTYFSDLRNFYSLRSTENSTLKSGPPCTPEEKNDQWPSYYFKVSLLSKGFYCWKLRSASKRALGEAAKQFHATLMSPEEVLIKRDFELLVDEVQLAFCHATSLKEIRDQPDGKGGVNILGSLTLNRRLCCACTHQKAGERPVCECQHQD